MCVRPSKHRVRAAVNNETRTRYLVITVFTENSQRPGVTLSSPTLCLQQEVCGFSCFIIQVQLYTQGDGVDVKYELSNPPLYPRLHREMRASCSRPTRPQHRTGPPRIMHHVLKSSVTGRDSNAPLASAIICTACARQRRYSCCMVRMGMLAGGKTMVDAAAVRSSCATACTINSYQPGLSLASHALAHARRRLWL